ncbi:complement decay-accelerating factor [Gracilinanus agilis]|uniref:complement decay-accelerating factor n=1 Tax=Gracilinanus agilis TaxID=191870 RepID=UPI001CFE2D82|nr:complement decay-accelerating factor [Gracilinanus agilis]
MKQSRSLNQGGAEIQAEVSNEALWKTIFRRQSPEENLHKTVSTRLPPENQPPQHQSPAKGIHSFYDALAQKSGFQFLRLRGPASSGTCAWRSSSWDTELHPWPAFIKPGSRYRCWLLLIQRVIPREERQHLCGHFLPLPIPGAQRELPPNPAAISGPVYVMSPVSHSGPPTLGYLGLLSLLLLLLYLSEAHGACNSPPDIPNAKPELNGLTTFPVNITITYKCNEGFVKMPGKSDSLVCLQSKKWSKWSEFCNRTCDVPPSLRFASLKKQFSKQNYFPVGSVVQYECRPGYRRDPSLPAKLTCLQNVVWSNASEFCKRKSCPTPPELLHGHVNIETDILLGSFITFTCNEGYMLSGAEESQCIFADKNVDWSHPHPECTEISCQEPPKIINGEIQGNQDSYKYGSSVTYICDKNLSLIGEKSIHCTVKGEQGEWSSPPPQCKDVKCKNPIVPNGHTISPSKPPYRYQDTLIFDCDSGFILVGNSTIQCGSDNEWTPGIPLCKGITTVAPTTVKKLTTTNAPATEAPPPTQQANPTNVPATEAPPPTPQANPTNAPATEAPPPTQQANPTNAPATEAPPPTQQANPTNAPATEVPPPTQQANPTNAPATKDQSPTQQANPTNAPATEAPPPSQQANPTNAPATKDQSPSQQANPTNAPATKDQSPIQQANPTNTPATKDQSPIQANPTNAPATKDQSPTKQTNVTNSPATEAPPSMQQANATSSPATEAPPPTQQANPTNAPPTKAPPPIQLVNVTNVATTPTPATSKRSTTTTQRSTRIVTTLRPFKATSFHTTTRVTELSEKRTTPSGAATSFSGKSNLLKILKCCCHYPYNIFVINSGLWVILCHSSLNAIEIKCLCEPKRYQINRRYVHMLLKCRCCRPALLSFLPHLF